MMNSLRTKIRSGQLLVGTFVKTPSTQIVEILGYSGLDFAVIDQEHAPIEINQLDTMAIASRATNMPLLTRRWGNSTDWIPPVLDLGMTGIMVPHVLDRLNVESICDAVKFERGKRGLSPSPRAGNYGGQSLDSYRSGRDAESVIAVQIEDEYALEKLDEIAAVKDVDLMFIGPTDLAQSMNVSIESSEVHDATMKIISAGNSNNVAVGLFVSDMSQIQSWYEKGVTVFVCGSDQSILRRSTSQLMDIVRNIPKKL